MGLNEPKFKTYDERNRAGCCARGSCEEKLCPDDTWINSLNNNKYCGPCKDFFYFRHDRFATGKIQRKWTLMPSG